MPKKIILIVIFILLVRNGTCCLNGETKELKDGTFLYTDREGNVPYGHEIFNASIMSNDIIKSLDSLYKITKDLDYLSDKGLVYIIQKKYKQAIQIYLTIETIEPNRYSTASNIGTAYELIGQNENALKWIKKSVEIDSNSHKKSEWIHIKILEAKINNKLLLDKKHLLNTDFGNSIIPISNLTKNELKKLNEAIYFQLNERTTFVKPKEVIVGELYFNKANIDFILGNYYDALKEYKFSEDYGYVQDNLISIRAAKCIKIINSSNINKSKMKSSSNFVLYFMLVTTFLLVMFFIYFIRIRKRATRS